MGIWVRYGSGWSVWILDTPYPVTTPRAPAPAMVKKQENISGKHSQHFTWIPAKPKPTMGNIWQINFSCLSLSHFVNAKLKSSRQALSSRTKLLWANSRARSDFQPKFSSLKLHTKPLRMGGCNVTQPGCILSIYSGPNLLGKVWNWSTHWPDTFTEKGRLR